MDGIIPESRKISDTSGLSNSDPHCDIFSIESPSNTIEIDAKQSSTFANVSQDGYRKQVEHLAKNEGEKFAVSELARRRSTSPSDAILIKRVTVPVLRVNTEEADLKSGNEFTG